MKRVSLPGLIAAALVLAHPQPTAAETARFRYVASVYFDEKGEGFHLPEGVACDANGGFIVGDTGHDRLVRFTYVDKTVGGGTEIKLPQVASPATVQLNSKGDIYTLAAAERRIVHLSPAGEFRDVLAFEGVPSPATVIPKAFTIDSADNIYVLDVFAARVLVLGPAGQFQRALAFPPDAAFGSQLAVTSAGDVLLLDAVKRRLFSAARGGASFAPLGGDMTEVLATLPTFVTASRGIIFVVEGTGSSIVGLGSNGTFLSRQLTMGWNEGSLNHPSQICINDKDEVFVADRDNSRIQVFQLTR